MIVYGDPKYKSSLSRLRQGLCDRGSRAAVGNLDELRELLIWAGQFEQGVFDWFQESGRCKTDLRRSALEVTEVVAEVFLKVWARANCSELGCREPDFSLVPSALARLNAVGLETDPLLTIKVPEGFAFYALYPEQYCYAALKWAQEHTSATQRRVLVVGIRSIGTSLSAVVKAALRAHGWFAERFSVRPRGHPFARKVELPHSVSARATPYALVVDEGPGLSGSSMAAVAEVLSENGIQHISFMPGHAGDPGTAASPAVRQWWNGTPRYAIKRQDLRWNGWSLVETLERAAGANSDHSLLTSTAAMEDISAGMWRRWAYSNAADWPAVCVAFERMKFLSRSIKGESLLWKFEGLGAGTRPNGNQSRFFRGAGRVLGFAASRWVEGRRLRQQDATHQTMIDSLATHISKKAGPVLSEEEANEATERLAGMAYCNSKEAVGDAVADEVLRIQQAAGLGGAAPSYGDGRMGPWEWVEGADGRIVKTDDAGHDQDHTIVGRQPIAWDIAGAVIEWGLDPLRRELLLDALRRNAIRVNAENLRFHECAYAAFRMGMAGLAASQACADSGEKVRLERAGEFYAARLLATVRLQR